MQIETGLKTLDTVVDDELDLTVLSVLNLLMRHVKVGPKVEPASGVSAIAPTTKSTSFG